MRLSALLEVLAEKARELEARDRTLYLRMIGIGATLGDDFRAQRAAAKGARRKIKAESPVEARQQVE